MAALYADVKVDDRTPPPFRNQATGGFSNMRDTIIDTNAVYKHAYETWGATSSSRFILGTGPDEAAQRADAATVAALKPFVALDAGFGGGNQKVGGLVFETALQQQGVPLVLARAAASPQSPKEASRAYRRQRRGVRGQGAGRHAGRVRRRRREGLRAESSGSCTRAAPTASTSTSSSRSSRSTAGRSPGGPVRVRPPGGRRGDRPGPGPRRRR